EGRHAVFADAIDPQAAVFGEHIGRQVEEPILVLAEQVGDVADREDGADRRHDQAAWLSGAERGCQVHGSNSSILWAGCSSPTPHSRNTREGKLGICMTTRFAGASAKGGSLRAVCRDAGMPNKAMSLVVVGSALPFRSAAVRLLC